MISFFGCLFDWGGDNPGATILAAYFNLLVCKQLLIKNEQLRHRLVVLIAQDTDLSALAS